MGRAVVATLVGLVVAMLIVMGVEFIGHSLFRVPEGMDYSSPESLASMMEDLPVGAKLAVVLAWFLGTLGGCFAAFRISPNHWPPRIVLALIMGGAIWSFFNIPHPLWMMVAGVVLPLAAWGVARRGASA